MQGPFGPPPLFFRVFGSFVALGFVLVGLTIRFGRLSHARSRPIGRHFTTTTDGVDQSGYVCAQCGAPLSDDADVSPQGDVKCPFCKTWFNIHGK